MARKPRIVVVGSSNTDMVVKTSRIPAPGETITGGEFVVVQGGKGANQAVAAARLGADVTLVACVGRDVFGDRALASIGSSGVNTEYVVRDDTTPSGVALIYVEASGQNCIVTAPGANMRLRPEHVDAARPAFEQAQIVVLQLETTLEAVRRAIDLAKSLGIRVVLNPAPMREIPKGFFEGVDYLTPNESEAAMLLGRKPGESDNRQLAQDLLSLGVGAAIVTQGSEGVMAAVPGRVQEIPARRVTAMDSTGAGDCFAGALACALAEGNDLGVALHFANAAAALSVTRMGSMTSLPTRDEVDKFIHKR